MSKIYNFLFLFFLSTTIVVGQSDRVVLVEEFTNASCAPCAAQNPNFNALLTDLEDQNIISLKYQVNFPGYDPMNERNPQEVEARRAYYAVDGVPSAFYDGSPFQGPNYEGAPANATPAILTGKQAVSAPLALDITHTINETKDSISVNVEVANESEEDYDASGLKLRVALTEAYIKFRGAPGSNGEEEFENIFRSFINEGGASGTTLDTVPAQGSISFSYHMPLPDFYDLREIEVLGFVQDDSNKEVVQAGLSEAVELDSVLDLSIENTTADVQGYCQDSVMYSFELYNNGTVDIQSVQVGLLLNGSVFDVKAYSDLALTPGQSVQIDFGTYATQGGSNVTGFATGEVNGTNDDVAVLNNQTATSSFNIFKPGVDLLDESFEGLSFDDNGVFTDEGPFELALANVSAADLGTSGSAGGYGTSARSLLVNYYQWDVAAFGAVGYMAFGNMDLSSTLRPRLILDRAKRTYTGENDRMEVQLSTDCGETWTSVYNKSGNNLLTVSGNYSDFYVPNAGDWVTDTISLLDYAGEEQVAVRLKFTSAWGNNMYLDNIRIEETPAAVNEVINENLLEVYPNPMSSFTTLDINLEEAKDVTVTITDMMGKVVDQVSYGKLSGNNKLTYNAERLVTGNYLFKINAGDEAVIRKVSVIK